MTFKEIVKFDDGDLIVSLQYQIEVAMQLSNFSGVSVTMYRPTARAIVMSYQFKNLAYAEMMTTELLMTLWEYCAENEDNIINDVALRNVNALAVELSKPSGLSIAEIKHNMVYNSKPLDGDFARILSENIVDLF